MTVLEVQMKSRAHQVYLRLQDREEKIRNCMEISLL